MEWSEETEQIESINGDRRQDRRYRIHLDLRWKLIRRRRVLDSGVGQTVRPVEWRHPVRRLAANCRWA